MSVAIVGCGRMGEALLAGMLTGPLSPSDVLVVDTDSRVAELVAAHGVRGGVLADAAGQDVVLVAVKPQQVLDVLGELGPSLDPARHLVVSVVAGVTTARLAWPLPDGVPVVRVMPNTPALVGQGMSVISPGAAATDAHLATVTALLSPVGDVLVAPEDQQDAVVAVSGSGPAYFFLVVEAMVDAGVALGLDREVATRLANQTALGAATLLVRDGRPASALREMVVSKGGTTEAALSVLEERGLRAAFDDALKAAHDRSAEIAAG